MQLSQLLGKTLMDDQTTVGQIDGICWQKCLPCLLKVGNKAFGATAVKLKATATATNLQQCNASAQIGLGKMVYNTDGKLLGKIADVYLTKTLKVQKLLLDNGTIITAGKVKANNDIVTVKVARPKPAKSAQNKSDKAKQTPLATSAEGNNTTTNTSFLPRRKSGDFSFLVGKIVDKNIFNFLGELMIKQGDIVTREVYLRARHFGKLTELCLHTK